KLTEFPRICSASSIRVCQCRLWLKFSATVKFWLVQSVEDNGIVPPSYGQME
ncbi:hypothetical protein E2320_013355, partial [Naja naja]